MALFNFIMALFFFNTQMAASFNSGRTFFHTRSTLSSTSESPRIYHLPTFSFKNNDDNEIKIKKSRVTRSTPIPNLIAVDTLEEFIAILDQPNKSDVVAVRFYAPWCKACASIAPSYHRLARRNPNAIFINVSVGAKDSTLHELLNVKAVPYGHIYHKGKLVGEMKQTKSEWKVFETAVKHMVQGYCNVDDVEFGRSKSVPL